MARPGRQPVTEGEATSLRVKRDTLLRLKAHVPPGKSLDYLLRDMLDVYSGARA